MPLTAGAGPYEPVSEESTGFTQKSETYGSRCKLFDFSLAVEPKRRQNLIFLSTHNSGQLNADICRRKFLTNNDR
jgi:hypothetical protein